MGGKKSTTTQNVTIPAEVMARYSAVNKQAAETAQRPFQKYGTTAADFVAQINPQQTAGIDAVNAAAGSYKPFMEAGAGATMAGMGPAYEGIQNYMSPYIKNVADTTGAMMRQQQEQAQSGALGTAAMSGAFGGDRAGIAAANLQQQNQMGYGKTMADIMNQGYTQALGASQSDLARQMAGGAQLAGIGAQTQAAGLQGAEAQLQAGGLQQQTEQAGKTALVNQFMQEQGYPFQVAQFLANIAMGTGALSGSTTTTQQPGSFWSDRRLKHDVKRIGHTDEGQPIYKFKYNGSDQTQIGLMADQVEKHHPDAVGTDPKSGYKYVDYDRATKAEGGGVAGPYGAAVGSEPWMEGYIPQAYLPVGQLMMADPSQIDTGSQSGSDYINQILEAIAKKKAYGGGVEAPNTPKGYLSDLIEGQNEKDRPELMTSGQQAPQEQGGGLGETLGNVVKIMGMFKDGGVVGRGGYADGGGPSVSPEQLAEFRRRQEAIRQNTGADMGGLGSDTRGANTAFNNRQPTVFGTEAGPRQVDQYPGIKAAPAPTGVAPGPAPSPMTAGEKISAALHPYRQYGIGAGHAVLGGLTGGMLGAASAVPTLAGAALSGLGGENYGGDYLINLGSNMSSTAGDIQEHAFKRAQQEAGEPYIPASVEALPQMRPSAPTTVLGRPDVPTGVMPGAAVKSALAPVEPIRPQSRTTGEAEALAADARATLGQAPISVAAPIADTGLGVLDPVTFFNTKIIKQESGGRQLDENGQPITSPKGAVGIAQVMEETGPEAAGLAGLEWDRNRWLYDEKFNRQIGQAYFLEQYRKFGSLDKAAAAYNAGPNAVSQAMDRASALGGSYVDYLPSETQNYIKSTLGGASGVAGPAPTPQQTTGGLSGANMAASPAPAGGKAYADRNALGQMMYDPKTNKLSHDAVLSIASGIGSMLASPSQFLLPTIGAGIAGGVDAMRGLRKEAADIASTQATTEQTNVATTGSRFDINVGGMPQVIMPGNNVVDFYTFKKSPELQKILGSEKTAEIIRAAEAAGVPPEGGASTSQVYSSPAVQTSMSAEENTLRALGGDRTTSNAAIAAINNAASAAGGSIRANTFMQLNAFAGLNANPAATTAGFQAPIRAAAVQAVNYAAALAGLPPISDMSSEAAIIEKAASVLGTDAAKRLDADTLGALNVIMKSLPDISQDKNASAKLMASIVQGQQKAVDLKNFTDGYISSENGNPTLTAFNAEKTFNDMTAQLYEAEKPYMEALIKDGGKIVDPSTGMTPVQALTSGQLSEEETADVLSQLFPGGYPTHLVTTFSR